MSTILADLKTRLFGPTRSTTIIVGSNPLTRLLAKELETAGRFPSLIDLENGTPADSKTPDHSILSSAGAKAASCVLAAAANDERNLELCRMARTRFGVPLVIARLKLLGEVTRWARINDVGMVRMSWDEIVSAIMGGVPASGGLARVAVATEHEQVAEVELLAPVFLARTIPDIDLDGCEAIALRRNDLWVDDLDLAELRRGDVLTLVGTKAAINKVRESFTSL